MAGVEGRDADQTNRIVQKTQTLEAVGVGRNQRKVLILVHPIEESVELSAVDLLDDLVAVRVVVLQRVDVVDVVGEHCLRPRSAEIVETPHRLQSHQLSVGDGGSLHLREEEFGDGPKDEEDDLRSEESPEERPFIVLEIQDEEDLDLGQDHKCVPQIFMGNVEEIDRIGVAPGNQLQYFTYNSQQYLQQYEYYKDKSDDKMPLLIVIIFMFRYPFFY